MKENNFDKRLLKTLVCPKTHTRLELNENCSELISKAAGLAYPIKNGIPILLANKARQIDENE